MPETNKKMEVLGCLTVEMHEILKDLVYAYDRDCYGDYDAKMDWICSVVEDAHAVLRRIENKLKIKVGKQYILRNGDVTGKLEMNSTPVKNEYPLYDPKMGRSYTLDGTWRIGTSNSPLDIVAKYIKQKKEKKVTTGTVSIWEYRVDFLDNEGFTIESQPRTVISANCAEDDDMAFKVVCAWADEMMDEYSADDYKIIQMK
jgi:hypothetical protein